jgi:hypothetical protein
MSKSKYCYIVVNKENGDMPNDYQLPIFRRRAIALGYRKSLGSQFIVHKIELSDIETLILKSKKS